MTNIIFLCIEYSNRSQMAELGFDLHTHSSIAIDQLLIKHFDHVISMG